MTPLICRSICALALTLSLAIAAPVAGAKVLRLEVTSTSGYGRFTPGEFVRIEGTAHGELDPSEKIPGLQRAPRSASGGVAYQTPFVIIAPALTTKGNGALLIDVPNRGRPISHFLYNSRRENFQPLALDVRNGFLQHQGFAVAVVQWELGQGIALPSFTDEAGTKRFVEGVGLAAIRDVADFLRNATGAANPLAGRVDRVLGVGYSQTARLLKSMLVEGFNHAGGRRVFDGLHIHASASGLADVMATGPGPASSTFFTPRFSAPEHRGVTEEPLSYAAISERAANIAKAGATTAATTTAATAAAALPKMLVTNTTTDYYNIRASLSRTGASGLADVTVPPHVRIYDIAGASHGRAAEQKCDHPPGQLDFFPVMRATLVNLDSWVRQGSAPPPSRLMPLQPQPGEPTLLQAPRHLPGAIVQVPLRDADGNSRGGVRLPELAVPLGTHGAQNPPLADRGCNLDAAYMAFAKTRAARRPADKRPSVEERYPSKDAYTGRIERAAQRLVAERLMLRQDVAPIVEAAGRAY